MKTTQKETKKRVRRGWGGGRDKKKRSSKNALGRTKVP